MSSRFALAALAGAAALSVAACGSSTKSSPSTPASSKAPPSTVVAAPTTPPAAPSAPPQGGKHVRGLIASVAGNAISVTQQNGTATVDFTDATKVTELTPAALTDVTTGSCVSVRSKDSTAGSVRISPAVNGGCAPDKHAPTQGIVVSVSGNTITINTSGAPQTVTVTDKTKYTKESPSTSQAIAAGKCLTAQGSETGGALQATAISLRVAANGKCPDGGGPHHH